MDGATSQEQQNRPWTAALVLHSIIELKRAEQPIGLRSQGEWDVTESIVEAKVSKDPAKDLQPTRQK